jgi:hypothetical protein
MSLLQLNSLGNFKRLIPHFPTLYRLSSGAFHSIFAEIISCGVGILPAL